MEEQGLRQLAMDIIEGKVFGTWGIPESESPNTIGMIFMPLILGAKVDEGTAHVYEYMSEAGPRSINGYPIFFSCRMLSKTDADALWPLIEEVKQQRDTFLNPVKEEDDDTSV